ncbi:hypothetical protein [uncultured Zoogloea sp.]|uniref:hypothetical protein n=1 Tax=uncultured Zoogloea sp. TaxID=160237 RepID=UPI002617EF69|nr:hypothetical protein [uncultured Zoogloea sp.]
MKTVRHLLAPVLLALALTGPASADDKTIPESDFNAYKELAQVKLDAAKESLQKDVAALGTRVDNQDKRIDQQGNRIGDVNTWLTGFSALVSVALAAIGLIAYFSVKSRARDEAQAVAKEEAPKTVEAWLATHETELRRRISDAEQAAQTAREHIAKLETEIAQLKAQASAHIHAERDRVTVEVDKVTEAIRLIGERMDKPDSTAAPIPPDLLAALERSSAALNRKDESEYTFDDWKRRGYAAYGEGRKAEAAEAWRRAADMQDSPAEAAAKALFNAGVALGELWRTDEAIATYELVDARYANDTAPALREHVAIALINKGNTLGQLGHFERAIATYDLVSARYTLNASPALREPLARTKVGKGFTLLCRAKADWANLSQRQADLNMAANLFDQATTDFDDKPIVLGNRAYCAHLRGEPVEVVRPLLERALKDGGEPLYKITLDDLATHPVPEDAAYRTLLDEVWAEVQGQNPARAAPGAG